MTHGLASFFKAAAFLGGLACLLVWGVKIDKRAVVASHHDGFMVFRRVLGRVPCKRQEHDGVLETLADVDGFDTNGVRVAFEALLNVVSVSPAARAKPVRERSWPHARRTLFEMKEFEHMP
jgi:hypothetical protein